VYLTWQALRILRNNEIETVNTSQQSSISLLDW